MIIARKADTKSDAGDAEQICGLDGQSYVGVSFAAGHLYFARYCAASPRSCGQGAVGAFRYGLRGGDYALARFGRRLTGFAYAGGGRAYEVRAADTSNGYCGNSLPDEPPPPCEVVLADGLRFRVNVSASLIAPLHARPASHSAVGQAGGRLHSAWRWPSPRLPRRWS